MMDMDKSMENANRIYSKNFRDNIFKEIFRITEFENNYFSERFFAK